MPGVKRRAPADLPALAEQLVAEPRQKANNLPVLLAALTPGCSEATPVLHSLRIFFIDAFDRGDLSVKPPSPDSEEGQSAEAVFSAWLHRQYCAYQASLLRLLGHPEADARTQVSAFMALMECVRGERPGVFNNQLFSQVLGVLLGSEGTAPEVLGLLIGRFLELADVRYFTLAGIIRLARQATGTGGAAGSGGRREARQGSDDEGGDSGEDEDAAAEAAPLAAAAPAGGSQVSTHDLARTLHDILAGLPPAAEGEEEGSYRSWCGAAEVGIVSAANAGEGSRQRKRQRALAEQQTAAAAATVEQQSAKWASPKAQQRMYSDAWLALLRMDCPEDISKKVLARVHDLIIPSLLNPLMLADFLTATLDKGGLLGMLALNGIFLLVTRHGLEYPRFYQRLYQLLTPDAFHAKHRSRFFSLADVFLASGMVPAYTAAAFVKRLARLALTAPPAGSLLALAFAHNIVRRHPATMQLLHRPPRGGLTAATAAPAAAPQPQMLLPLPPEVAASQPQQPLQQQQPAANGTAGSAEAAAEAVAAAAAAGAAADGKQQQKGPAWQGLDVFDFSEPDPGKSRALESSLWELEALRQHYNPQVAAYCAHLDKDLRDRKKTSEVDISELLGASYAGMFAAESARRLKAVPTAFYSQPPQRLFEADAAADWAGWAF